MSTRFPATMVYRLPIRSGKVEPGMKLATPPMV